MSTLAPAAGGMVQSDRSRGDFGRQWETLAEAALRAYGAADFTECGLCCRRGGALLDRLPPEDPRRASTLNNLGMGQLLEGDFCAAAQSFAEAGKAWRRSKAWVERMTPTSRARSSLFHLRLEQRHRQTYAAILRTRHLRDLAAGRAASLFNRALALCPGDGSAGLARPLETAVGQRRQALGPRNPEVSAMLRLLAPLAAAAADPAAERRFLRQAEEIDRAPALSSLQSWQERGRVAGTAERALLAAVYLTIVATPEGLAQGLSVTLQRPGTVRADPTSGRAPASP